MRLKQLIANFEMLGFDGSLEVSKSLALKDIEREVIPQSRSTHSKGSLTVLSLGWGHHQKVLVSRAQSA